MSYSPREILSLVAWQNWNKIDRILFESHPRYQSLADMIELLDCLHPVRHQLEEYHIYLDAVATELRRRGLDADVILKDYPLYSIDRYP